MSRKIRVGNDIDINWSLLDKDEQPYIVEGRTFRIELLVGSKRVRIPEATADGNRIHFVYYGKDQKNNLGSVNLIYIENDGVVDMVTFDTKDAFTMVPHSWLALDEDETPETITLEVVTVLSNLQSSIGPRGYSAYEIAVHHGYTGTEEEWLDSLKPHITADADGNVYCDGVLLTDVVYRVVSAVTADERERQEAETARQTAESARAEAETARRTAENARAEAETARQAAESGRQTAEAQRGENETTRQSQETARQNAEQTRQSNESTRQSQETARESAEQERVADFEALKTDMETATSEADAATAAAVALNNQVAGDESARQTAESSRNLAEQSRVSNENARETAESTRQTKESERQTAEQTRNTQEGTRQTQESTRQTKEGERQTAEEGRAAAESGRVSAEEARQTAETAREEQATSDHQRAEGDHAIAENDHATLDEKISHKADIDGSYDGMAVGIARNLEGRTDVTDSFLERTTGGDAEVANGTAQLNEVKGKSQVWNQLVKNPCFADGDTGWGRVRCTISISNGIATITPTASDNPVTVASPETTLKWIQDHKYLFIARAKGAVGRRLKVSAYYGGIGDNNYVDATGDWQNIVQLFTATSTNAGYACLRGTVQQNTDANMTPYYVGGIQIFDLTLLGIDNLTTVDEVEAWLAENIGEQAYYPYNPGEVLNNRMTGVESIGFNLLDPATGKADIIGAYSDVYGNYYGITGTHGTLTFTDKFGNEETITPDSDGKFLLEKAGTLSVADAGEDCAVFLWWDGTQTEYKPYEKNVGHLDVTHIYGKLNGEGDYVRVWPTGMPGIGDIKDSLKVVDGQVVAERKVGEVDLGTLTWIVSSGIFYHTHHEFKIKGAVSIAKYPVVEMTWANFINTPLDKVFNNQLGAGSPYFEIKDGVYDGYTAAQFKEAIAGTLIYFEFETPQVYTDLIYRDSEDFADNTPVTLPVNYKVDNWGIERIVPQNTEEAVVTAKPELTMRYSIDAVETMNTHSDQIEDLYEKNEELDQRKPEKYGEYPDMAVGSANTLAGQDTKVEDFVFKALDCADGLAKLNSARGKSLVMNQLVSNGDFSDGTTGWSATRGTLSVVDNVATLVADGTGNAMLRHASLFARDVSHKYYVKVSLTAAQACRVRNGNVDAASPNFYPLTANVPSVVTEIYTPVVDTAAKKQYTLILYGASGGAPSEGDKIDVRYVDIFDLTLMFGAGNEPATVEEFEAMFPLPYYDYNPGEIISNKTEEVKVVGFNQWDEEVEEGNINAATGANASSTNRWRSKNYIPVFPNTDYYFCNTLASSTNVLYVFAYDASKNYIGCWSSSRWAITTNASYINNVVLKTPLECHYIRIQNYSGLSYENNICINLSDPARNGEYEPYKTNTIELNLPTLTGKLNGEGESVVVFPDGLKSAGSVYDEIVGNKAIKRVGKKVFDGTEIISNAGNVTDGHFRTTIIDLKPQQNNIVSSHYTLGIGVWSTNYSTPMSIGGHPTLNVFYFYNGGNITTVDEFKTWLAAQYSAGTPVVVYYELATPEEYILDAPLPDTFQAYKGGTIKQLPENTSEPVTASCVLLATYSIDAVGNIVGLPRNYVSKESLQAMLNAMQSAGIIASYTMTYNENTGKYDFTFVAPTNS